MLFCPTFAAFAVHYEPTVCAPLLRLSFLCNKYRNFWSALCGFESCRVWCCGAQAKGVLCGVLATFKERIPLRPGQ